MIARLGFLPFYFAGFLTLTPPDEALGNLGKWWEFVMGVFK